MLGLRQLGTISELHVLSNACCLLMHLFFHGLRSRILTLVILNFFSWGIIGFFAGFSFFVGMVARHVRGGKEPSS